MNVFNAITPTRLSAVYQGPCLTCSFLSPQHYHSAWHIEDIQIGLRKKLTESFSRKRKPSKQKQIMS